MSISRTIPPPSAVTKLSTNTPNRSRCAASAASAPWTANTKMPARSVWRTRGCTVYAPASGAADPVGVGSGSRCWAAKPAPAQQQRRVLARGHSLMRNRVSPACWASLQGQGKRLDGEDAAHSANPSYAPDVLHRSGHRGGHHFWAHLQPLGAADRPGPPMRAGIPRRSSASVPPCTPPGCCSSHPSCPCSPRA